MASNQNTPARLLDPTPSSSNYSQSPRNVDDSKLIQQSRASNNNRLDQIESQIGNIESKLKQNKIERERVSPDSEELVTLEQQRKELKKELIKLDIEHEKCFEGIQGASQDEKNEKKTTYKEGMTQFESRIIESQLEYSRRLQEELEKIKADSLQRQQQIRKAFSKQQNQQESSSSVNNERNEKSSAELDLQLAQARYQAKMAQLEAELADNALRRSRQIQLEAELSRLRLTDPLRWAVELQPSIHWTSSYYIDPLVLSYDPMIYSPSGLYYL